jgi:probable HAF family extracellular repeat protein
MRTLLRSGLLWPCCLVACSTPLTAPNPGAAPTGGAVYRLDWIAGPDGVPGAAALDINDRGEIAGATTGGDAFTWSAQNGFVALARLPTADFVTAFAINESGVVAGTAEWYDGTSRPVIWTDPGQAQELGLPGTANDINDRGHVVGTTAPQGVGVAYLWDATNGVTILGTLGGSWSVANDVNSADEVVGTSELADGTSHAFLWSNGTMIDLGALDGGYSDAAAITDAGEVTGTYQGPSNEIRVYRWTRSEGMIDVGPRYADATDGATSLSTDLNSVGQIIGGVQPPGRQIRAAVRQPASGAWQELIPESPLESFAQGMNNRGVIVGHVAAASGDPDAPTRAAMWTPVPSVAGAGSR